MEETRVTVITGGSGSLGGEMCRLFGASGDRVYVGYNGNADMAEEVVATVNESGGSAAAIRMDLAEEASIREALRTIQKEDGPVSVLINNAAIRPIGRFLDLDAADWDSVIKVNVMGAVWTSQQVIPGMVEAGFGRILNISGGDALWGWGNRAHVTTSKAALQGLTRALAVEYATTGITVNTILPGSFETQRKEEYFPTWPSMLEFLLDHIPMGRQGRPAELAAMCYFLASRGASYITGQDIHVNGGAIPLVANPDLG